MQYALLERPYRKDLRGLLAHAGGRINSFSITRYVD